MIRFAETNSRWKDYYDIYLFTETFEFESQAVANAIRSTFANRPAKLTDQVPYGLGDAFATSRQDEWETFLQKSKLFNTMARDFPSVAKRIWQFLEYPLREVLTDKHLPGMRWARNSGWK